RGCVGLYSLSFFFSSRRRHTRFSRDWSSDVCSSDLSTAAVNASRLWLPTSSMNWWPTHSDGGCPSMRSKPELIEVIRSSLSIKRSEERRVGKECRCRWWPCHRKDRVRRG